MRPPIAAALTENVDACRRREWSENTHYRVWYENLAVFDFELREDEMAAIQTLARPNSRIVNPAGLAPVWDAS